MQDGEGNIRISIIEKNPERFSFEGAGFLPGSKVEIKVTDDKDGNIKYTTSAIADDSGDIEGEISIGSWNNGTYILHEKGISKRDRRERTKHIRFEHFKKHIWN
jgi:hypothetical protein